MTYMIRVYGKSAPSPRMTKVAALLLAIGLSVPVFVVLSLIDWLWL
ncbi:hypothetical protein [Falsiruegeria mediterranea]|nr:hypothetical protein [Falsiruegeria mediterranea]